MEVTDEDALPCSGLELPLDSSPGDDEGGVGGRPKSKKDFFFKFQTFRGLISYSLPTCGSALIRDVVQV